MRVDGRNLNELRPTKITRDFTKYTTNKKSANSSRVGVKIRNIK